MVHDPGKEVGHVERGIVLHVLSSPSGAAHVSHPVDPPAHQKEI